MTNKQMATLIGAVMVAVAAVLAQCPDPAPQPAPPKHSADAGTPPPAKPLLDAGRR